MFRPPPLGSPQIIDRSSTFTITNNFESDLTILQGSAEVSENCRWDDDHAPPHKIAAGTTSRDCRVVAVGSSCKLTIMLFHNVYTLTVVFAKAANPKGTEGWVTYTGRVEGKDVACYFHIACPVSEYNLATVSFNPAGAGQGVIHGFKPAGNPLSGMSLQRLLLQVCVLTSVCQSILRCPCHDR